MRLVFATRPSALARWQTRWVMQALHKAHPDLVCEQKVITTRGDRILDQPLPEIGGKGVFTQELEAELLSDGVDCAVHSLKDLPVDGPAALTIGCIPARGEAREALVSARNYSLDVLPKGAVVGTSSLRRSAQLLALRPDLQMRALRGNVDTRLRKVLEGGYDAIIVAGAGLMRLGLEERITEWIPLETILPAPGQGALAVQCRTSDQATLGLIAPLEDGATRTAVTAERAFLSALGGGCAVPVAAYAATAGGDPSLIDLTGLVISADGSRAIRVSGEGPDAMELGRKLALQALAQGAGDILNLVEAG